MATASVCDTADPVPAIPLHRFRQDCMHVPYRIAPGRHPVSYYSMQAKGCATPWGKYHTGSHSFPSTVSPGHTASCHTRGTPADTVPSHPPAQHSRHTAVHPDQKAYSENNTAGCIAAPSKAFLCILRGIDRSDNTPDDNRCERLHIVRAPVHAQPFPSRLPQPDPTRLQDSWIRGFP